MLLDTISADQRRVRILDQTRLPLVWEQIPIPDLAAMAHAIRSMQLRGAPLIGAAAAFGVALAMDADTSDAGLAQAIATLAATRPTAVNLHWALARMQQQLAPLAPTARVDAAWQEAERIRCEDITANQAIGEHGLGILRPLVRPGQPLQIMTHCNAGALATCGWGTALAPIYLAHQAGLAVHVWVSETRPRNQGYLTAAELSAAGVPHTLIADNAAGLLIAQGKVDVVITGADRIAANGDTANKVGTYLKALAARAHGIPFYIAAPWSTIDLACPGGHEIPIEERDGDELRVASTATDALRCMAEAEAVFNPAFDVTPAGLISGVVTERGVFGAQGLGAA